MRAPTNMAMPQLMPTRWPMPNSAKRSEEHTSELQSRLHLVCRLLLEKKIHDALLRASACRETAAYPYIGYGRKDRKGQAREADAGTQHAEVPYLAGASRRLKCITGVL